MAARILVVDDEPNIRELLKEFLMEEGYEDNMSIQKGKELVFKAVKSAVSRDIMSGDGVDFLIITKEGIEEEARKF